MADFRQERGPGLRRFAEPEPEPATTLRPDSRSRGVGRWHAEVMTTLLIAGATGATGTVLVPKARAAGLKVIPHVRPKTAAKHLLGTDPDALVCDLSDKAALDKAMAGCEVIACLVGTTRHRFAQGDSYESSDYQPVIDLIESAKRAGGAPRYFILLSALGSRKGSGYLGWKFRAEEAVQKSGLPFSIIRPSFFDSSGTGAQPSDGKSRTPPPIYGGMMKLIGKLPGLHDFAERLRPISLDDLAGAIVKIAIARAPSGQVLEGDKLRKLL